MEKKPDLIERDLNGEIIILCQKSGVYYSFNNEIAIDIWKKISEKCSEQQIIDFITSQYDVPREQAISDIKEFIDDLLNEDLISTVNS
ncbi:MAG TPA: PqqD family protein [bacterium]|nr:PqqD family protein [bacterium]